MAELGRLRVETGQIYDDDNKLVISFVCLIIITFSVSFS